MCCLAGLPSAHNSELRFTQLLPHIGLCLSATTCSSIHSGAMQAGSKVRLFNAELPGVASTMWVNVLTSLGGGLGGLEYVALI